jgi:hypothetical protein
MIPVTAGGTFRLVYKTSTPNSIEVKLGVESKVDGEMATLTNPIVTEKNGWTIADYDLNTLNGKTIYMIALNLKTNSEAASYETSLGEIAMLPANYAPQSVNVSNFTTTSKLGEEKGDIRLTWDYTYNNDFDHFDIYTVTMDGTRKLVGQTRDEAFYIPTFERNGIDANIKVEIMPVMKDMKQQVAQSLNVDYPAPTAPIVSFKLSKSYIKVGETATIIAKGTCNPLSWKWVLPEGLKLANGSSLTNDTINVIGVKEGKQSVTVEATNSVGTSSTTKEVIDIMSANDEKEIQNVVLKKKVISFSGSTNDIEIPDRIIDGVTNPSEVNQKWCNVAPTNWAIFDCLGAYRIYGFRIYDCKSGPEDNENIDNYTIELSNDGKNWTTVVNESNREKDNIKTDYIAPMTARYVRLTPHVSSTLRIWEFEVYGRDDSKMTIDVPTTLKINASETKNVTMKYALNGDRRGTSFFCTATPSNDAITVGSITENASEGTFSIPITASKMFGTSDLLIKLDNDGAYKECNVNITIDMPEATNVLSGKKAELRQYKADYKRNVEFAKYETLSLTDGDKNTEACSCVEKTSTHLQDFWSVFTADNSWNLSKVKINIPANNYGNNDNGKAGIVNKAIEIWTSGNGESWTVQKKFENLNKISELEYILPQYTRTKYLAIVCTLNPYFYPSLAEVEAFEQSKNALPSLSPVLVSSGWNADVIAEKKPSYNFVNNGLDKHGWVFYTSDVQERGALSAPDGIVTSASGIKYQIANFSQNNALKMDNDEDIYDITFSNPINAEEIYLLGVSTGGSTDVNVAPVYNGQKLSNDDFNDQSQKFEISNWCNESPNGAAIAGLGRIIPKAISGYSDDQIDTKYWINLYELTLQTDKTKKITGLQLQNGWSTCIPTILAISQKGSMATDVNKVKDDKTILKTIGIYTINGIKISHPQKGLYIIRYSDGTAKKIIIK